MAIRNVLLLVLGAVAALGLVACGDDDGVTPIAEARSDLLRQTTPAVSAADFEALITGNTDFAFDLYRALAVDDDGNLFLSPHSISTALAMALAGARGDTAAEMVAALRFPAGDEQLHAAVNALDLELAKRPDVKVEDGAGDPPELSIVNAAWGDRGQAFLDEFLDVLALHYGAGMRLVDFAGNPEGSRVAINEWVEQQTKSRIRELIPQGIITTLTELVLTNAIYFKGSWLYQFDPGKTAPGSFETADGRPVTAEFMNGSVRTGYGVVGGAQVVDLPYVGGEISMLVLLPAEGGLAALEGDLDADRLEAISGALSEHQVTLALPKFEFTADFLLNEPLKSLGMRSAFEPGRADLSGIDGTRDLFISAVLHKAFVSVDEKGTEAAAATAVVIGRVSAPPPAEMTVDRPFLFAIRDNLTGAVLFLGRVTDPTAE